ncbi:MAG: family 1 encapsulin nanocompartment shell protein, partial [Sulfolobales archaeon]
SEALRLSIIAELDAINLYLQIARSIDDDSIRRVFEDIAREEKTHVGEFLAILKNLDPEQVSELEKGEREVGELVKGIDPSRGSVRENNASEDSESLSSSELEYIRENLRKTADSIRVFRHYLPLTRLGRGADATPLERDNVRIIIPLEEISKTFIISQRSIEYSRQYRQPLDLSSALSILIGFALDEDRKILEKILGVEGSIQMNISSWEEPGRAVEEISRAVQELIRSNAPQPYILFLSPSRYTRLLAVYERTGVMELTRVKTLVKEVVQTPILPDELALVVSSSYASLDLVLGGDTEIDYVGPEDGGHKFRVWETLALRIRNPRSIAVLRQQKI